MNDLTEQVIKNSKMLETLMSQRKHAIVRVCGEEHSCTGAGKATTWLSLDNDMAYVSEMKFKLVLGNPNSNGGGSTPIEPSGSGQRPQRWGNNLWPNLNAFLNEYPLGTWVDCDGYYGAQCWDYANAFWTGQVNRRLETGGGNARGTWTQRAVNAGNDFELVYNWSDLKPGDWAVWGNGQFGHIAMAKTRPSGSSCEFYGQNQGGAKVKNGGAAVNVTNLNSSGFLGAFRYKKWA